MHPLVNRCILESCGVVRIVTRIIQNERFAEKIRDKVPWHSGRHARQVVEHEGTGVSLRQIECSTGSKKIGDDIGPLPDVGKPIDRTPSDKYQIERPRLGKCLGRFIEVRLDEFGALRQPKLCCQVARGGDRRTREIDSNDSRATLGQNQAVTAKMTLQMQDSDSVDGTELCLIDWC